MALLRAGGAGPTLTVRGGRLPGPSAPVGGMRATAATPGAGLIAALIAISVARSSAATGQPDAQAAACANVVSVPGRARQRRVFAACALWLQSGGTPASSVPTSAAMCGTARSAQVSTNQSS